MSLILVLSILIRIAALGWAVALLRQLRDWRMALLCVMVGLMALRQILTLLATDPTWSISLAGNPEELPGLLVSVFALAAVYGLERIISEQRDATNSLRRSQRIMKLVMDTIPQRLFWKDRTYRYIGCNKVFARDAGLESPEQIVGMNDFELAWKASAHLYREDDIAVVERGVSKINYEEPQVRVDGTELWLRTTKLPLRDESGEVIGVFGSYEDITEHKRAEEQRQDLAEQLRQAQKMEVVGQLAGGVAHDFNNVLTSILGHGEMVLRETALAESVRRDVDEINTAAERGAALTRQLLAFSRRQVLVPRTLNLNEVVVGLEGMLRRLIGENIDLAIVPDRDLGLVRADPVQLEQVVLNLAINARDAMPDGGKLVLETRNVELDEVFADSHVGFVPGAYVLLSVRDNGCGMDAETRRQAFEPFFTTKEAGRGTGLGLSMVYGIVQQSGGQVWLESETGRGTICRVYLPRVAAKAERVRARPAQIRSQRGSETVLIVEDEQMVRTLARRILEEHGYTVLSANDPMEALELMDRHGDSVSLLVADVVLPQMSGRDLAERLRETWPATRVLYMSGYMHETVYGRGMLESGVAFLQKPFGVEALLRKVREELDEPAEAGSNPNSEVEEELDG